MDRGYLPLPGWGVWRRLLVVSFRFVDFFDYHEPGLSADASHAVAECLRAPLDEEQVKVVWPTWWDEDMRAREKNSSTCLKMNHEIMHTGQEHQFKKNKKTKVISSNFDRGIFVGVRRAGMSI